ncbi:hypothetical protein B7494_g7786 [Chlorociboria aeruginascens]|nr:hypothetical protein B7494_g7786 [Chlorociboria aeruginascens]
MSRSLLLRHIHLPDITQFSTASTLQTKLVSSFLQHKAALSSSNPTPSSLPTPIPTLLTFTPTPVYTLGRREAGSLSAEKIIELKQPFLPRSFDASSTPWQRYGAAQHAEVVETLRGGQITYHGPGQLVIYPILDLRNITSSKFPNGISPKSYIHLLEEVTIRTIAAYGIQGIRTENPGVWLPPGNEKIAAVGVHLRRNIASYGVGLNVSTDLRWWDRIVGCGLQDKGATNMKREIFKMFWEDKRAKTKKGAPTQLTVSNIWAREFIEGIWGPDVPDECMERIGPRDIVYKKLMGEPDEVDLSEGEEEGDKLQDQHWTPLRSKTKSGIGKKSIEGTQSNSLKSKSEPSTWEVVAASSLENRDEPKQQQEDLKEATRQKLKDEGIPGSSPEMELATLDLSTASNDSQSDAASRNLQLPNRRLKRYERLKKYVEHRKKLDARLIEARIHGEGRSEMMEERGQWELVKMMLKDENDLVDTSQKGKRMAKRDEQMWENNLIEATRQETKKREQAEGVEETVRWKTPRMVPQDEDKAPILLSKGLLEMILGDEDQTQDRDEVPIPLSKEVTPRAEDSTADNHKAPIAFSKELLEMILSDKNDPIE